MAVVRDTIIAGNSGGKRISMVPACVPAYKQIESEARKGTHWALITMLGLKALTSGRLAKDNIFVRPNQQIAYGQEEFFVHLPGCTATAERLPNDTYRIVDLRLDFTSVANQGANNHTGMYRAQKVSTGWNVDALDDGTIIDSGKKVVAIADRQYSDASDAAREIAGLVSKAPGAGGAFFNEFHLHYTAGKGKLGGLKNYTNAVNPNNNSEIHESAILLAKAMHKAKDIPELSWVAALGGSAVLTQALSILASQNVKLKNHTAFLYRPSTNVEKAAAAAHSVGLTLDRNFVKTEMFDFMGNRNQFGMIRRRLKAEKGYGIGNAVFDGVSQAMTVQGLGAMAIGGLSMAGVSLALPAAAVPLAAKIASAFGITVGALKTGDTLANNLAPHLYNKHIGKIK
ncbi:hypothetical protein TDB9533_00179 [Thalassocella blandensis]|nr:hypothetical protein TDB9533_00179 [Thalassocella blandensis]